MLRIHPERNELPADRCFPGISPAYPSVHLPEIQRLTGSIGPTLGVPPPETYLILVPQWYSSHNEPNFNNLFRESNGTLDSLAA